MGYVSIAYIPYEYVQKIYVHVRVLYEYIRMGSAVCTFQDLIVIIHVLINL